MVNGKELVGALLQGWSIGAATVKTVSVVEKLTTLLGQSNALDNVGEVVRRLQQYDNLTELTNKVSTLIERVYRLESVLEPQKLGVVRVAEQAQQKKEHEQLMQFLSEVKVELAKRSIEEEQPRRYTGLDRATIEPADQDHMFVSVRRRVASIAQQVANLCGDGDSVQVMQCKEGFPWVVVGPHVGGAMLVLSYIK